MSFNAKTISLSVAALLAIAGGVYAFMPSSPQQAPETTLAAGTEQNVAAPAPTDVQPSDNAAANEKLSSDKADNKDAAAATQAPVAAQPAPPAPKKLTQQQLTPPPLTEDEKLQQAAQQESNF